MANLLFIDEGHEYELNGERIPSVSELTRFLSREIYSEINQTILDTAADRGTRVHDACENLDRYGDAEIDEDIMPYVKAFIQFRKEHKAEWNGIEKMLYHREYLYAGRLDRAGTVDGKRCIVDIKTSSSIQKPLYTAQLNLYRMMVEQDAEPIEKLYILHLTKDGKYKLADIEISDAIAMACITLDKALRKKPRKKKEA